MQPVAWVDEREILDSISRINCEMKRSHPAVILLSLSIGKMNCLLDCIWSGVRHKTGAGMVLSDDTFPVLSESPSH